MMRSVLIAVCLACTAGAVHAEIINSILATVDGEPITLYQVNDFQRNDIRARQAGVSGYSELLEALITEKIVEREVSDKGIIVSDQDVQAYIDGIKQRNQLDDEKLQEALRQQGLTMEAYRRQIREDLQRQQLIAREIRGRVSVSPEEIQRYYEAHADEFATPARVEISHILLRLPEDAGSDQVAAISAKAQEIHQRVKAGEDFAEAAKRYSEDPTADDGGKLGWFKKGELLEPMEQAAAKLKPGQISEPVRTRLGIHILRLDGREAEGRQDLSDHQEQIKQRLYAQALEERFQKWISEELRKRHHVEILRR